MPELPEVETVCRGLAPHLEGRRLVRVEQRRPNLRTPFPPRFCERLTGRRIESVRRRAKYILMHLDDGGVLIAHLGMSGRMIIAPERPESYDKHDHVVFETDAGTVVTFNDARRFGLMDLTVADALGDHPMLRNLGPEPLGPEWTGAYLHEALAGRKASIKLMLLDQRIVAGLGNIYVCEALHLARISPKRQAGRISRVRLGRLVEATREVLLAAIEAGGSSLRDYVRPDGELGYFSKQFAVYGREGQPCACGGTVARYAEGGRSTFWCPACQNS